MELFANVKVEARAPPLKRNPRRLYFLDDIVHLCNGHNLIMTIAIGDLNKNNLFSTEFVRSS